MTMIINIIYAFIVIVSPYARSPLDLEIVRAGKGNQLLRPTVDDTHDPADTTDNNDPSERTLPGHNNDPWTLIHPTLDLHRANVNALAHEQGGLVARCVTQNVFPQ